MRRGGIAAIGGVALAVGIVTAVMAAPEVLDPAALLARSSLHSVVAELGRLDGSAALDLRNTPGPVIADGEAYATLAGTAFHDGEIEGDIAAEVLPNASEAIRAFVGLGFRADHAGYEAFYLRMRNGRSEDQLQRNHAAQYISHPGYGWRVLRGSSPGRYESYVDLAPGRWTHVLIRVCGGQARLFVDHAVQPTLIVRDLKKGASARGQVILWVGPGTAGQFAGLTIRGQGGCGTPGGREDGKGLRR